VVAALDQGLIVLTVTNVMWNPGDPSPFLQEAISVENLALALAMIEEKGQTEVQETEVQETGVQEKGVQEIVQEKEVQEIEVQ
jgi:hypothetical protein